MPGAPSKAGECWCAKETFRVPMPLPPEAGGIRGCMCPSCLRLAAHALIGGGSQLRWLMSLIWKDRVMDGGMKKVFVIGIGAGNPDYVAVQVIARLTKWTCSLLWTRGRIKNS